MTREEGEEVEDGSGDLQRLGGGRGAQNVRERVGGTPGLYVSSAAGRASLTTARVPAHEPFPF